MQQVIAIVTNNYTQAMEDCGMDVSGAMSPGGLGNSTPLPASTAPPQAFADDLVPEKVKSLAKMKEEKLERKRRRHYTRIEYRSLGDLIRFVDYLAVETLVALAVNSAKAFYEGEYSPTPYAYLFVIQCTTRRTRPLIPAHPSNPLPHRLPACKILSHPCLPV